MNKDIYIADIYNGFLESCNDYSRCAFNAKNIYTNASIDPELYNKLMRDFVIEHSFLKIYICWEHYIENVFLAFMLGCKGLDGGLPVKYVTPISLNHAYSIVTGINPYPDWSDMAKILILAQNFFEDSGPFILLNTMKSDLAAIKKIRNNIAHMSQKSEQDFENLVRGLIGFLPTGINTSSFLVDFNVKNRNPLITYFQYYVEAIENIAKALIEI